jgi:hypothetical protein
VGKGENNYKMVSSEFKEMIAEVLQGIGDRYLKQIETRIPTIWPRWMTIKTAAKYIDHSDRSFEYLMSKDLFPVVRRDRLVLLDREDIDAVLKRLKQ